MEKPRWTVIDDDPIFYEVDFNWLDSDADIKARLEPALRLKLAEYEARLSEPEGTYSDLTLSRTATVIARIKQILSA